MSVLLWMRVFLLLAFSRQPLAAPRAYLDTLLATFPSFRVPISDSSLNQTGPSPATSSTSDLENLIDPLSPRELEVLHLIAQSFTNAEIAEQLFVSPQTIKVHTRNIYGKLNVHNRQQAVAKARVLGLLYGP